MSDKAPDTTAGAVEIPPTVSHLLGEMAWLLSQSPLHNVLAIKDLEWLVMPALIHQQFYVFREGEQPVGLALWAKCSPTTVAKLEGGMLEPENHLSLEEWNGGPEVWLVDLVAPFATAENKQREMMIADLIAKPLRGLELRFHQTDPLSGVRTIKTIAADAGDKLLAAIEAAAGGQLPN